MSLIDRDHVKHEGTKVFPPLIPITMLLVAWLLDGRVSVVAWEPGPWRWAGLAVAVVGLVLMAWSIMHQFRRGTDPNPYGKTSALVTDGPYAFSRNPIYLADIIIQTGVGALFALEWALLLLPVTWFGLWILVIRNEERYLADAFGDEYADYRQRVRRWK